MRILFITATRLGDAVLSTGVLDHLLRAHPGARVTVACGPVAAGVFDRMPGRERTLIVAKKRFDLHWPALWRNVVGTLWDLVVDLRGSALSFFLPARRRLVLRSGRKAEHKTAQLAALFGLPSPPLPVGWVAAADEAEAARLLPGEDFFVGLGPTANWNGKVWPAERFAALFRGLAAQVPGAVPVVFAGPGEAESAMAAPVLAALPGAVDLRGGLPLPLASAALARCRLFAGNDSGLMHLSAAIGTPTLGLFGPTPAREYGPAGRRTAAVLAAGPEGGGRMADLPVERALRAATALLGL